MKIVYFLTLLIVLLCAVLNIPGMESGFWYSYAAFGFCSVLLFVTLIFGIVNWKTL